MEESNNRIDQDKSESAIPSERDYTTINLNRAIFLLAGPMILEMIGESLFAVVDVFFVSRLSVDAVATVGLTESVMMLVYSLAFGLGMAATAMIARRVGEKDIEAAKVASIQSIYIAVGIAAVIAFIGFNFAPNILQFMGASESVVSTGYGYTQWMLGGNLVIMLLFLINGIFRGAGDAVIAMWALLLANFCNMILDPLLIFGLGPIPAMGIEGAAIATNTGRGIAVLFQLYILFGGKSIIRLSLPTFSFNWVIIKRLLNVALGGTGQFLVASASWVVLMLIMSDFGSEALAGYTIAIRVIIFSILPAWGLSNAAATLVGQNLGAGRTDRAEQSVWRTALINMLFLGSVSITYLIFAHDIIELFTSEPEVLRYGSECLWFVSLGYIFYAYGMVIGQAFNGAGDTKTPTILNFFGFWVIQIPLAYLLATNLGFGPKGVYWAISISESILAISSIIIFRRGKWKTTMI